MGGGNTIRFLWTIENRKNNDENHWEGAKEEGESYLPANERFTRYRFAHLVNFACYFRITITLARFLKRFWKLKSWDWALQHFSTLQVLKTEVDWVWDIHRWWIIWEMKKQKGDECDSDGEHNYFTTRIKMTAEYYVYKQEVAHIWNHTYLNIITISLHFFFFLKRKFEFSKKK